MAYSSYIDGTFIKGKESYEVVSPWGLSAYKKVFLASKDDASKAIDVAYSTKKIWSSSPYKIRVELLKALADALDKKRDLFIDVLIKESGKSLHYAQGEVDAAIQRLRFAEKEVEALHPRVIDGDLGYGTLNKYALVIREPYGVVLAITPFNYPLLTMLSKVVPALLGGNVVIVKPSLKTPISALEFAKLFDEVSDTLNIPKGIFQVIVGKSSEIGDVLIENNKIDAISFTGSTKVGKYIASKAGLKKLHMELGGKGIALVLDDAHLSEYVKEILQGALKFSGQRCDSLNRIIVLEQLKENFKQELLTQIKEWRFGDPYNESTKLVPLIDAFAADKVETLIGDAVSKGAQIIYGGKRVKDNVYELTILDNVNESMEIYYEEVFGPVISIVYAKTIEDAIKKAQDTKYGLDASIFSQNLLKAMDIAKQLGEGAVTINAHPSHAIGYFPFGGNKDSGIGREGVYVSLKELTRTKTIVIKR